MERYERRTTTRCRQKYLIGLTVFVLILAARIATKVASRFTAFCLYSKLARMLWTVGAFGIVTGADDCGEVLGVCLLAGTAAQR